MFDGGCVHCRGVEGISWWLGLYLALIPDFPPPSMWSSATLPAFLFGAALGCRSSCGCPWCWRTPLVRCLAAAVPRVPAEPRAGCAVQCCLCLCSSCGLALGDHTHSPNLPLNPHSTNPLALSTCLQLTIFSPPPPCPSLSLSLAV